MCNAIAIITKSEILRRSNKIFPSMAWNLDFFEYHYQVPPSFSNFQRFWCLAPWGHICAIFQSSVLVKAVLFWQKKVLTFIEVRIPATCTFEHCFNGDLQKYKKYVTTAKSTFQTEIHNVLFALFDWNHGIIWWTYRQKEHLLEVYWSSYIWHRNKINGI